MKAPVFQASTVAGPVIDLKALHGKRVWLAFYRYAGCPLCNLYIHKVLAHWERINGKGIQMLAVFESPHERFPKFIGGRRILPFPMIPDPGRKMYQLYGLEPSWRAFLRPSVLVAWITAILRGFRQPLRTGTLHQAPAHFLIDEQGVIRRVFYGSSISDNPSIDEVVAAFP